jgi:hypothetical protein
VRLQVTGIQDGIIASSISASLRRRLNWAPVSGSEFREVFCLFKLP